MQLNKECLQKHDGLTTYNDTGGGTYSSTRPGIENIEVCGQAKKNFTNKHALK
jgi:hypothetical protein